MISGFRKPKRSGNIRRKVVTDNDDEQDVLEKRSVGRPVLESPTIAVAETEKPKTKDKAKKGSKSAGLLSFEDDLESADMFQVKKSKESKMLAKRLESERKSKNRIQLGSSNVDRDIGLTRSEKDAVRLPSEFSTRSSSANAVSGRPLKSGEILNAGNVDSGDDDSDSVASNTIKAGLNSGFIPDAATIFAVKKKREQARQLVGTAEFIPVVSKETKKYEGRFPNANSRLVREEDDDDSDEDRMEFKGSSVKSFPALERRSQVAKALEEAQEDEENDNEEEDEVARWEKEQIKKGTGIPAGQSETAYGPQIPADYVPPPQPEVPIVTAEQYFGGNIPRPPVPPSLPVSMSPFQTSTPTVFAPTNSMGNFLLETQTVSIDMVAQRLSERLSSLVQVHRSHKLELDKISNDLESSKNNIDSLELNSVKVSERFSFYQDLQGYFQDFVECLNEKVPKIMESEKLMHLLWRVRAEKFLQRRADDIKDQDSEVLGKSNKSASSLDEYGRDRSAFEENTRKRRVAEREGRRNRRKKHREKTMNSDELSSYHEGMSSDDEELDADVLRFEKDKGKILAQAATVFDDVIEDFSSISEVQSRFVQWRLGFGDSYTDAFANLSLPKVYAPFMQLELLNWNPLEANSVSVEDMEWYKTLKTFGDYKGRSKEEVEECQERLSLVVHKNLMPKLTVFVESVWDPLSTQQTERLSDCIRTTLQRHKPIKETDNQRKDLLKAIVSRLKQITESGMFLPLYGKGLIDSTSSGALSFLKRQFWASFKMLKNMLFWTGILSAKDLQDIVIDGTINRYLIAGLQQLPHPQENSEISRTIISVLPKPWFETTSEGMLPVLEPFSRYLVSLAGSIYKASLGYSSAEKKKAKLATKRIISLLMHMHAFDIARTVAVEYKYDVS